MADQPSIRTERLLLRPWRETDLAPFAALNADPRVMEFMPALLTREQSDAMAGGIVDHFEANKYGRWAVEAEGAPFIGFIGLHWSNFDAHFTPALEIGFRLAADYWGKGYATEGGKAAVAWAFDHTDLPAIYSWTALINRRSDSAIRKIGLSVVAGAEFNHPRVAEGNPLRRHNLYRVARGDWIS
jgi:ribosomal-protein-alanine N-acetyltransferase